MQSVKENVIKAIAKQDRVVCGVCGALLARRVHNNMCTSKDAAGIENKGVTIEIKCKHKDAGKVCNAINEVSL